MYSFGIMCHTRTPPHHARFKWLNTGEYEVRMQRAMKSINNLACSLVGGGRVTNIRGTLATCPDTVLLIVFIDALVAVSHADVVVSVFAAVLLTTAVISGCYIHLSEGLLTRHIAIQPDHSTCIGVEENLLTWHQAMRGEIIGKHQSRVVGGEYGVYSMIPLHHWIT